MSQRQRPGGPRPQMDPLTSIRMEESDNILRDIVNRRDGLPSTAHELVIQQQADKGRVVQPSPKGKAAKSPQNDGQRDRPERATKPNPRNRTLPLDPPAVLEYICHDDDPKATWMDSPNIFCTVDIVPCDLDTAQSMTEDTMDILVGSRVVSLQHVTRGSKDNPRNNGFLVFAELTIKKPGNWKFLFKLYEIRQIKDDWPSVVKLCQTFSNQITVECNNKQVALRKSTDLTQSLSEAGIKVRVRKEPSKRKPQTQDWKARPQKNPTAAALPMPITNGLMMIPSANGEDIRGRLSYQRANHDHANQGPYAPPFYVDPFDQSQFFGGYWDSSSLAVTSFGPVSLAPASLAPASLTPTNLASNNPAWDNLASNHPAWDNPAWDNPAWDNLTSNNLASNNLDSNNLASNHLASNHPASNHPASNHPASNNPASNKLTSNNLASNNLASNNLTSNSLAPASLAPTNVASNGLAPASLPPTAQASYHLNLQYLSQQQYQSLEAGQQQQYMPPRAAFNVNDMNYPIVYSGHPTQMDDPVDDANGGPFGPMGWPTSTKADLYWSS